MPISNVYNKDCMEAMREFPDKWFELAVVDPEYGRKEHGGRNRSGWAKQKNGSKIWVEDGKYVRKDWDNQPVTEDFFNELLRVTKDQIIWGG